MFLPIGYSEAIDGASMKTKMPSGAFVGHAPPDSGGAVGSTMVAPAREWRSQCLAGTVRPAYQVCGADVFR